MRQILGTKMSMKPETEKLFWEVVNNIEDYAMNVSVLQK